jgi:hypothetical protein
MDLSVLGWSPGHERGSAAQDRPRRPAALPIAARALVDEARTGLQGAQRLLH